MLLGGSAVNCIVAVLADLTSSTLGSAVLLDGELSMSRWRDIFFLKFLMMSISFTDDLYLN